ncbi:MAG TPA: 30S ribosomal protein S6 [Candidatus Paceibacterota bacterium]|nr:30S ribosomal protein S6 [Candidatus Paceibacterota bacterium]
MPQDAEQKEKRPYEIAFLVKEEEAAKDFARLFSQHGVLVRKEGQLKKIQLAYPVEHATQAYFGFFEVEAAPQDVKQLEKDLRTEARVLRTMIMKIETESVRAAEAAGVRPRRPMSSAPRRAPAVSDAAPAPMRKPALSNEALEKKIEEILQ